MPQKEQTDYITTFAKNYAMDRANVLIVVERIGTVLKEQITVISKQLIECHYVGWFTNNFGMNESNCQILIKDVEIILQQPISNPSKQIIENDYVAWFKGNYGMDTANIQILTDRYKSVFNEPLVYKPIKYDYEHDVACEHYSSQGLGVAAGDLPNDFKQIAKDYAKVITDGCIKGATGDKELMYAFTAALFNQHGIATTILGGGCVSGAINAITNKTQGDYAQSQLASNCTEITVCDNDNCIVYNVCAANTEFVNSLGQDSSNSDGNCYIF
jgi:hypothetical protein